eukprot:Phypoly_transcript_05931.p1 GENE.Phypoly_transcript_05931~~Phypoly_transcript_05931.p1  ORF type:complete len:381 (+),score=45.07 Phypoly_transcript_05931:449-1591(+)
MVTLDFWGLRTSSQVIHLILAQLGCSSFVAAMTALIRRRSLSVWLAKNPQRKYNDVDNVVICHQSLLRLGITLLLYNLAVVLLVWTLLSIYSNTEFHKLLRSNSIDPTWFAFFTAVCSFNQTGFALLQAGLIPINNDTFFALTLSLVILFSNTLLPLVVRGIISIAAKVSKEPAPWKFMLEHPRICSTVLFPALQTKILTGCVLAFFILQITSFALLDFNYPVLKHMSGWHQFIVSIFQAANNMHAGFPVVQVNETNTAQQWCYFIFMLVAVYPYVSMLRNTEVVREGRDFFHPDSLLKQSSRNEEFERQLHQGSRVGQANIVWTHSMQHLKQTFLGDAFWLIFAVFLICVWEGTSIETDPEYPFSLPFYQGKMNFFGIC